MILIGLCSNYVQVNSKFFRNFSFCIQEYSKSYSLYEFLLRKTKHITVDLLITEYMTTFYCDAYSVKPFKIGCVSENLSRYRCDLVASIGFEHKFMFKLCSKQQFILKKLAILDKQKACIPYGL